MKGTYVTTNQDFDRPWFAHYDQWIPRTLEYPEVTLQHFLSGSARKCPDRDAIIFYGGRLTYRELDEGADRFATALVERGLAKGDRVSVFLPNCPQMVIAYYGTLRAGGVVVSTSPLYSAKELEYQLNDSGSQTIVVLSKLYPLAREVAPRTGLKRIIITNIKEYFPPLLRGLFTVLKEKKEGHRIRVERSPGTEPFAEMLASAAAQPPTSKSAPMTPPSSSTPGGPQAWPRGRS